MIILLASVQVSEVIEKSDFGAINIHLILSESLDDGVNGGWISWSGKVWSQS